MSVLLRATEAGKATTTTALLKQRSVPFFLVLETALPAKFEDAITEALGHAPERPAALNNIEQLPQRFEVMNADVDAIKAYIVANT